MPQFNVLCLDPIDPDSFPTGLMDAVTASSTAAAAAATPACGGSGEDRSIEERLREQMRADALQPLDDDDGVASSPKNADLNSESHLSPKLVEDAAQFLCLNVSTDHNRPRLSSCAPLFFFPFPWHWLITCDNCDKPAERLDHILEYMRAEYHYCFWCGTQYKSSDEMQEECPGPEEDMHD